MPVILSEVEESLDISESARDVATSLDMTNRLFNALDIYCDDTSRSAAINMAIDEALLESAAVSSIRFYRWASPALSFGYFGRFAEVATYTRERDLVRRWTGGGIVFHGEDLTYSIVIPSSDPVFGESSMSIYQKIHCALADALASYGAPVELAAVAGGVDAGDAVIDRGYSCFANPVRADVMLAGRKIAGAAQRRTRAGLLQQGSIQGVDFRNGLADRFAKQLSGKRNVQDLPAAVRHRAHKIAAQKYGTDKWLRKR
jgi:lipoate-protein ligase A